MNAWLVTAVVAVVLLVTIAGVGGIFLLTKSIGRLTANAIEAGWQHDDVTRLVRKVALFGSAILLLNLLPWSLALTTVGGMADQYFRNIVNQWMSGADLFRHLAIDNDEYYGQPLHWRQGLAEITLREGDEDEALRQFISRLDSDDIRVLESVAKYALGGTLVVSRSTSDGNPRDELSRSDLMHLEAIGIIDSVLPVNHESISPATDATAEGQKWDGLWLAGEQYAIHLRASTSETGTSVSFHILTEIGRRLVAALRRPTSIAYLCWLQRDFRERQVLAEIWSITREGVESDNFRPIAEITGACESSVE